MIDTTFVTNADTQRIFSPGDDVVIDGLIKCPAFNGLSGKVESLDEQTGRYNVLLPMEEGCAGQRFAKVKGENLRPAPPQQPPCFIPLLPTSEQGMTQPAP